MTKNESLTTLQDALIIGCDFKIGHDAIAPYTYGYYVTSKYVKKDFCETVTCYDHWLSTIPKVLYNYLLKNGWTDKDFLALKDRVDTAWANRSESYEKDTHETISQSRFNYIANGYETDGLNQIVSGQCEGNWSTYTTNTQNELAEELIILRGYCMDYYLGDKQPCCHIKPEELSAILLRHEDVEDAENWDLNQYMKDHPNRMYD